MKTSKFFAIAVALFALAACSDEEKPGEEPAANSKLSIRIVGETSAPTGRAEGTPDAADESKINDFILFVFRTNGDNDVDPKEFTTWPTNGKADIVITEAAKEVYVIANTKNNKAANDALLAVKKKSDLQAVIGRGFTDYDPTTGQSTQTSTNLWMSGKNDAALKPVKGESITTTVTMKFLAAKVRITSVTIDPSVTGLTLSQVIVLNGGGATSFIPADGKESLIPNFMPTAPETPFYVGGVAVSSFTNKPAIVGRNDGYFYALTADKTITSTTNQHYFYVFENDGETFKDGADPQKGHPTIVTLKALNADLDPFYYSVFFKADPDGTLGYDNMVIERGKSYDIAMTIKKQGNSDPTIPILNTSVEVTITPATWTTVTIDKTYE